MLLVSNIILWFVVILLALLVLALSRQIGVLYERVAPAGALAVNQQLKVGDKAPEIGATDLAGKTVTIGRRQDGERSQLVFFLAPSCPICKTLLPILHSAGKNERGWLQIVLASDGETIEAHQKFVDTFKLGEFPYVLSELLGRSYGVSKLPYAVLIDENGLIASMGIINSREHLESLFEAKERAVGSVQEYLGRQASDSA